LDEAKWLYNSIKGPVKYFLKRQLSNLQSLSTHHHYQRNVLSGPQALLGLLKDPQRTAIALEFLDFKMPDLFAFHFNDLVSLIQFFTELIDSDHIFPQ